MLLVTIVAVVLFVLALDNAYEFSLVSKVHRGEAKHVDVHSRVVEAGELLGFILAGFLLYLSELDIIAVAVLLIVGPWQLFHLMGALTNEQRLSQFSQKTLNRLVKVLMAITFMEVVVAGSIVVWMASNGLISL